MISRQFLIYVSVGLVSALVDVGLMQLLISANIHYLAAATFGFISGFAVNFFLHARITFQKDFSFSMFARYVAVVAANYGLTLVLVQVFYYWLSMPVLGKIVSLPVIAITGFILSKYWIYKSKNCAHSSGL